MIVFKVHVLTSLSFLIRVFLYYTCFGRSDTMSVMLIRTPPAANVRVADNNGIIVNMNDKEFSDLARNSRPKEMMSSDSKKVRSTLYLHNRLYFLSFTPFEWSEWLCGRDEPFSWLLTKPLLYKKLVFTSPNTKMWLEDMAYFTYWVFVKWSWSIFFSFQYLVLYFYFWGGGG